MLHYLFTLPLLIGGGVSGARGHAQTVHASDPCKVLENHDWTKFPVDYVKPSVVNACMDTIPMDIPAAADALKGIEKLLDTYTSDYYTTNTGNPALPIGVDLHRGLHAIGEKLASYKSLPAFTRDVQRLFVSLHDGHTGITFPCTMNQFFEGFLPLVNLAPTPDDPAEIYVTPLFEEFLLDRNVPDKNQFKLQASLAGAKVLEIDGLNVVDYLISTMNSPDIEFGLIDPNTRWNRLFMNLRANPVPRLNGGYAFTQSSRSYVGQDDFTIKVEYKNGTQREATLPFYGLVRSSYPSYSSGISFADYWHKYVCLPGDTSKLNTTETQNSITSSDIFSQPTISKRHSGEQSFAPGTRRVLNPMEIELEKIEQSRPVMSPELGSLLQTETVKDSATASRQAARPTSETVPPTAADGFHLIFEMPTGVRIYQLQNTTLGVIQHLSFMNMSVPVNDYLGLRERRLRQGLVALRRRGVKQIILELSGNNGGYVVSVVSSILQMFPEKYPMVPVVYRSTKEVEDTTFDELSKYYTSLKREEYKTNKEVLYTNQKIVQVNSVDSKFTQPLIEKYFDAESYPFIANSTYPPRRVFEPENIIIVSNGFCVSSCHLFASFLRDTYGVKTVGFGGLPKEGKRQQVAGGMRGAQAKDILQVPDPTLLPYNFTLNVASFSVNYRAAIDPVELIPQEFVSKDVDFLYQHTNKTFGSLAETWKFVASRHLPQALKTMPVSDRSYSEALWKPIKEAPKGFYTDVDILAEKLAKHEIAPNRYPAFPR